MPDILTLKVKGVNYNIADMVGATSERDGDAGIASAPTAADVNKFWRGDGTWAEPEDIGLSILDGKMHITYEQAIIVPHADDPDVKRLNIKNFIEENINTPLQIGFQCDSNGRFYVGAGDFSNVTNPNISTTGTLIYSAESKDVGDSEDNYERAHILGDIINYILFMTKGDGYGTNIFNFPGEAITQSETEFSSDLIYITNGFTNSFGRDTSFGCYSKGYSGYYKETEVISVGIPSVSGNYDYDGTEKSVTITHTQPSYYTVSGDTSATQAGTYTVTFTLKDTSSSQWSDGTTTPKSFTWTIAEVGSTVTVPSYSGSMTYNGSEQTASFENYDSSAMTVSGNTGTNAGDYTATFSLSNPLDKWSDGTTADKTVQWSIGKATLSGITVNSYSGYTYGASSISTPVISSNPGSGTVTFYGRSSSSGSGTKWSSVTGTTYDAGTRYIYATITGMANYEDYTTENRTFTISKGTLSGITVSISGYTYGGTKSTPSISSNPGSGTVTYYGRSTSSGTATSWSSVTNKTYDAGTRYCYATITGMTNYNDFTTGNKSFTISKADFTTTVSISGYTYGGTKSTPSVSNNPGNGSVTYYGRSTSSGSATTWSNVTSTTYDAGTRYVYAVIASTTNYNSYTTPNKSFTISKGTLSGITVNSYDGYTYGASSIPTPTISSNPGNGTVTFYGRSTSSGTGTKWSNMTGTTFEAGTRYIYATITEMTNYNDFTTANRSYTIDALELPHKNDSRVKTSNIEQFINNNMKTSSMVGFQSDENGKFYVKSGSFSNGKNPNINTTGVLIFDAGGSTLSTQLKAYECGAIVGDVMNYILYLTRGHYWGGPAAMFPSTPEIMNEYGYISNNGTNDFFYHVTAYSSGGFILDTISRYFYGKYGGTSDSTGKVMSYEDYAVWW